MRMNCSSDESCRTSRCLRIALCVVAGIGALGLAVMLLWNWLMPALFVGVPPIGFWQALGILALSKILFGGFRGGGHEYWRERRQRWAKMTPEEREQLKAQCVSRWGRWCASGREGEKRPPQA
ncbi:MAG: hypothetical protein H6R17_3801 [Proteobacteria bacterium]|nr:hypothetical protein [Pseudomonadota bacterium]